MRPHPDLDLLALHALGEPVLDEASLQHVQGCGRCAQTVTGLAGTVRTARGPEGEHLRALEPVPVPAHVWQGISSELGLDPSVRPASVGPSSLRPRGRSDDPAAPTGPTGPTSAGPADPAAVPSPTAPPSAAPPLTVSPLTMSPRTTPSPTTPPPTVPRAESPVVPLAGRRARRTGLRLLAVAAAGLVVGAAGTALLVPSLLGDPDAPDAPDAAVLAAADLEAFGAGEGTDVSGSARLAARSGDDTPADDRVLQVWLDELPDTGDGFFEAWLIDPETGAMVSLGPVPTGRPGEVTVELPVPRGLDVAAYDLVDVSAEPLDGDPTHSGVSLVRGTLGT